MQLGYETKKWNVFHFITDNWNKRIRAGLGANCYNYDGTTRVISLIGQLHLR